MSAEIFNNAFVGAVPSEWQIVPLRTLAKTSTGGTPDRGKSEYFGGGIPWVKSGELDDGTITRTDETLTHLGIQKSNAKCYAAGTLLIALYGATVGKTSILGLEAATNQAICAIFPHSGLITDFLKFQLIARRPELLKARYGGAQPNISQQVIREFFTIVPPLPEQCRMAAVLNTIQNAIAAQEDVIAAAKEFKRSLMHRLFAVGPGREPAPTKETEIGEVPAHWEFEPIGTVAELQYGYQTSIPKTAPPNGVEIISTAEIRNEGFLDLSKIRTVAINPNLVDKYQVRKNDILFNWRNSQEHVGKTALVEFEPLGAMIFASFIVRVRPIPRVGYRYLHYLISYMRSIGVFFTLSRRAVNQANFNASHLGSLLVPIPDRVEQTAIESLLSAADAKIAAEEDRLTALQALFKSMLYQLMTGQIRLLSDEGLPLT